MRDGLASPLAGAVAAGADAAGAFADWAEAV
jgi:hypothetical protein